MAQGRSLSLLRRQCWLWSRRLCSEQPAPPRRPVPAVSVQDERVQSLLTQLTGLDLDKVFAARKEPLRPPTYKLLTREQLEKAHEESVEQAKRLLQMPPVLPKRQYKKSIIEVDEKLSEAIHNRFIFTETTQHKEDKDRWIVVREVDGTLREASWNERDRMCQLFFPKLGRKMNLPQMLQRHQLPEVLSLNHHPLVLDVANVQCEPDSKEYIRVHKTVYNDIEKRGLYDLLWSTRYFGGFVWHLLKIDDITGLFKHTIDKERWADAAGLVRLHLLCYPESDLAELLKEKTQSPDEATDNDLIETFWKWVGGTSQLKQDNKQDIGHDKNNDRGHTSNGAL